MARKPPTGKAATGNAAADPERVRLEEEYGKGVPWKKWGPYLSERQWGTVREDYSDSGTAWDYFTHDQARSRAYRWGEDGIAGVSDEKQRLCFALALWNGADPILKERLFGLSNSEGNHGEEFKVSYLPGDSDSGMFGGNSNWRGPIWFPVNALIVRALLHYYTFLGKDFTVECPTGSGRRMNLFEVAREIGRRLTSIFLRDPSGRRLVYGEARKFQEDPHWRDLILFYEYFHGDSGAGIGASHQTGWTGLVAKLIQMFSDADGDRILETRARGAVAYRKRAKEG